MQEIDLVEKIDLLLSFLFKFVFLNLDFQSKEIFIVMFNFKW